MHMKVLGIGQVVLDKIYILPEYPSEGAKVEPTRVEFSFGGPVTTALTLLSRLGAKCTLITPLGKDKFAASIRKKMRKERVRLIPYFQKSTKTNVVLVNTGGFSRTIIHDRVHYDPVRNIAEDFIKEADIIVMDRHEPFALQEVIQKKRRSTPIIFDPSTEVSETILSTFHHLEHLIIPIESVKQLSEGSNIKKGIQKLYSSYQKPVIITAGVSGSIIYDQGKFNLHPAYDIKAVDPLGAGDIFRGGFAWGLLNNWNLSHCVEFANLVAGLQCTRFGNGSAIPTKNEIADFSKSAVQKNINLESVLNANLE